MKYRKLKGVAILNRHAWKNDLRITHPTKFQTCVRKVLFWKIIHSTLTSLNTTCNTWTSNLSRGDFEDLRSFFSNKGSAMHENFSKWIEVRRCTSVFRPGNRLVTYLYKINLIIKQKSLKRSAYNNVNSDLFSKLILNLFCYRFSGL